MPVGADSAGGMRATNAAGQPRALVVFIGPHAARYATPCAAGSAYSAADLAPATGTYVGCMFGDYMNLLRVALQQKHTGPGMTGGAAARQPAVVLLGQGDAAAASAYLGPRGLYAQRFHRPVDSLRAHCIALQATVRRTRAGVWPTPSDCRGPATASTPPAPPPWWPPTTHTEVGRRTLAAFPTGHVLPSVFAVHHLTDACYFYVHLQASWAARRRQLWRRAST